MCTSAGLIKSYAAAASPSRSRPSRLDGAHLAPHVPRRAAHGHGNGWIAASVKYTMFADTLAADLRLAVRRLVQRPGFSAIAVATLALGLGANVALFTLIEATMYQRLPVARPDELVRLGDSDTCCVNSGLQTEYALFSYDAYRHLRDRVPELASLAAFQASSQTIGIRRIGAAITESVPGEFVSGNYFATLGVAAAAGRLLDASD